MILLNSHVLAWFYQGGTKLGRACRVLLNRKARSKLVSVSSLTYFEIEYAIRQGSLKLVDELCDVRREFLDAGGKEFPADTDICMRASEIRHAFVDPFDALIVATADVYDLSLITADERILAWKGRVRRIDARK